MRFWLIPFLLCCSLVANGQLRTFDWDADPCWPEGTQVELEVNGTIGLYAPNATPTINVSGNSIHARARAIPPEGYQCGDPLALCQQSDYVELRAYIPSKPVNVSAIYKRTDFMAQSLWPSNPTPQQPDENEGVPLTLGVKFKSAVAGYITGIRFFKSLSDPGSSHTVALWDIEGNLLASKITSGESENGWQQISLNSPISIDSDTPYVAGYFSPNGRFTKDPFYLSDGGHSSGDLYAYGSAESPGVGGNGVFSTDETMAFPTTTVEDGNYWVDVVFETSIDSSLFTIQSAQRFYSNLMSH